jgi:ABC-2 type transport system ATP-binding protein
MSCAIETSHLSKRYPVTQRYRDLLLHPFQRDERQALEDVSLRLPRGELAGLLGRNGAGKTTLIKILCTLVLPSAGRALVNGHDVARDPKAVRRSIGFVVSEERSFYWRLSGRQNLAFFATLNELHGAERDERIRKVVDLVGLQPHAERMFKDYSSGMKQRLAIARGLLTDPEILFLDEPTKTLDPLIARDIRSLVKNVLVGEQGRSVVFATNNLKEADTLFDSVTILESGRVVASGTRREIGELLAAGELHRLRVRGPDPVLEELSRSLRAEEVGVEVSRAPDAAGAVEVKLASPPGGPRISSLIQGMVAAGIEVESCTPLETSLEDVFARIVEKSAADVA